MRRCFTLLICLIAFAASSCDDKTKEEIADVIVLSRSSVAFATEGGTTTISVASPSEWTATCPDGWVTLHPEGDYLTISVGSNATPDIRNAKITVKSDADQHEVDVRQAYALETVLLSTTAPEEISFDSEGEDYIFTVITNGEWTATCDAEWLSIDCNKVNSTVTLSTSGNPDAHRTATLAVSSSNGKDTKSCEVTLAQDSHAENRYYKLLGYYGLFAQNWYYGGSPLGVSGTGTFCTVEQKEYRKSVYIKDLFVKGTVVEAAYDKQTGALTIELGKNCLQVQLSASVTRTYYLMTINMNTGSFVGGSLTGTLGEGYNDDAEEMRKAILLGGFDSGYSTLGLIGYQSQQYVSFSDVYYATGSMYLVQWDDPSATTDVTRAAAAVTPPADSFPVYPEINN